MSMSETVSGIGSDQAKWRAEIEAVPSLKIRHVAFVVRGEGGGGTDAVAATALAVRSKMSRPKSGGMQSWQLKPSRRSVWADMEAVFVMSVLKKHLGPMPYALSCESRMPIVFKRGASLGRKRQGEQGLFLKRLLHCLLMARP